MENRELREPRNAWGLPVDWSKRVSLGGVEIIGRGLAQPGNNEWRRDLSRFVAASWEEYQKLRGKDNYAVFNKAQSVGFYRDNLEHLKLSSDEKLEYFREKYPKGFTIRGDNSIRHLKWEKILDFELWMLSSTNQSLDTIESRGGSVPIEVMSVVQCVPYEDIREVLGDNLANNPEELLRQFELNGWLND